MYKCPNCKKSASSKTWNIRTKQGRYGYDSAVGSTKDFQMVGSPSQNNGKFHCPNCYKSEIEGKGIVRVTN